MMDMFNVHLYLLNYLGAAWRRKNGLEEGQTQSACSVDGEAAHWAHPIDLHLETKGLQSKVLKIMSLYTYTYILY